MNSSDSVSALASRRIVLRAAMGVAALAASGIGLVNHTSRLSVAQEIDGVRAHRYVPDEAAIAEAGSGTWLNFSTEFPFWAVGASWNGDVGEWPVIHLQTSADGTAWSEIHRMAAQTEDAGRPARDDRLFTALTFADGATHVRFRTTDIDDRPGVVAGLSFVYIDPTDGPWQDDLASDAQLSRRTVTAQSDADTLVPPEIITRAHWGANENWRFTDYGEIWPPEYEKVSHIIVHHTATSNRPIDVPGAIRAIYYYHAVEQDWGDIGYNYLVDHNGRIYQGRYGGQNVIGGHAYQFAIGSSGIGVIGDFTSTALPEAAKSALVSLLAWLCRDLDPLGVSDFHQAPQLPTISSHRDVNATLCPGSMLWSDLPEIRLLVAQTLEEGILDTGAPAGIAPGDRVRVRTVDGSSLGICDAPEGAVVGVLATDDLAWVTAGPTTTSGVNWYRISAIDGGIAGWVSAEFLIVDPLPYPYDESGYPFGLNVRFVSSANLRRGPSIDAAIVGTLPPDTLAAVMTGPLDGDGVSWYLVTALGTGDGWVASSLIEPAPFDASPATASFSVGDIVETTNTISIRIRPGLPQATIATARTGSKLTVTLPPVAVNGFIWYGAYSTEYGGGWITEDGVRKLSSPGVGKFSINDAVRVVERLNLREAPTPTAVIVESMSVGVIASVLAGSERAGGYTWWQLRTSAGKVGWAAENWLEKISATPPDDEAMQVGDAVRTTTSLNVRASASTSATILRVLPMNTVGAVMEGPITANGYVWYRIQTASASGWVAANWLERSENGPPASDTFATIGDRVRVSQRVNLRASAGTTGSVVMVLSMGTQATITGGPADANGYTWWRIQIAGGITGWSAEDYLVLDNDVGTPTGYPIGTLVQTTAANVRLRAERSTASTIVAVLPRASRVTILGEPVSANGYRWLHVRSDRYGTGYIAELYIAPA